MVADAGPPWTEVRIGTLPLACSGSNNQPWTLNPSLCHFRLCTRAGTLMPALTAVRAFHLPATPVRISGGEVNDSIEPAVTPDGHANDRLASPCSIVSAPLHNTLPGTGCVAAPRSTSWVLSPASSCASK